MDIRFEKVAFTYQPHSPFEQRVLFDIDLAIKEGSYTSSFNFLNRNCLKKLWLEISLLVPKILV